MLWTKVALANGRVKSKIFKIKLKIAWRLFSFSRIFSKQCFYNEHVFDF